MWRCWSTSGTALLLRLSSPGHGVKRSVEGLKWVLQMSLTLGADSYYKRFNVLATSQ